MATAKTRSTKSERLNFRVTPEAKKRLERLLKHSESHTLTEVLQRALSVYDEVLEIQREGGRIVVEDGSGESYRWRVT